MTNPHVRFLPITSRVPFPPRERLVAIVQLALPIIGGMLSQNFLNLVDTLMVGRLGDAALAGVGIASFVHFFSTAFITGIATGVQATVSRRMGQGRENEAALPLNGALLIAWVVGLPLSLGLMALSPLAASIMSPDQQVVSVAGPYLAMRFIGLIPLSMNFSFRGFWNGVGKSKIYFRTIVLMHTANVALNYVLIFGKWGFPEMGATGAGLASALAFWIGSLFYFVQALSLARDNGFLRGMPSFASIVSLVRLAAPTGIQQTFFAGGMTVFFSILAKVGTQELAASNVLVNLLLVVILPSIGFGLASATLVGQALGKGNPMDARLWGAQVATVAFSLMATLGLFAALVPHVLLGPFLTNQDTLKLAEPPLRLIALGLPIDTVGLVLMHSMLGAGYATRMMTISVVLQWGLQLPLIYLAALVFDQSLTVIWAAHFGYRAVQTAAFVWEWQRGRWQQVAV